ncbi:MAG: hypothetical protein LQ352_001150 [Teloschistes flavicans]|nr:MAG: hypothetical protein LQ352_001150 [Teloschistes flavicans]
MQADDLSTLEDDTRRPSEPSADANSIGAVDIAKDLVKRCHELLNELKAFHTYIKECRREHTVEVKPFLNTVTAELRSLEKLRAADPESEKVLHTLRSSNLPFYAAVWDAAKTTSSLVAFTKRFYWDTPPTRSTKRDQVRKQHCALVDVIAQDGKQWIKVSTITETRLLFELAKAGWEGAGSSASDSDDEDGILVNGLAHTGINDETVPNGRRNSSQDDRNDDRVEIVRQAFDLQKASLAHKVHYRHPTVHFILPKISQTPSQEIARILDTIRSTGASIHLGAPTPSSNIATIFQQLAPDHFSDLTPTLNIDCTILLALVSDLSHDATRPEPWFHRAIARQIELEKREQLLPSTLWPAMTGRILVCTQEAARRMREIVEGIGTGDEKRRTELLLSDSDVSVSEGVIRRKEFQDLSTYVVPSEWRIPIQVVPFDPADPGTMQKLPPVAETLEGSLSLINQSVFFHGWITGYTTLSSNRTVAKQIEEIVEAEEGEVEGPKVWVCGTARSLVGREKGRRDMQNKREEDE